MVGISRSFRGVRYEGVSDKAKFGDVKPISTTSTVVNLSKDKNRILVVEHERPQDDREWYSRSWKFDIQVSDWEEVTDLLKALKQSRDLEDDIRISYEFSADQVEQEEMKFFEEEELESDTRILEDLTVTTSISSSMVEFGLIPEPDLPIFPAVPIGEHYSLEGVASDTIHLDRLIELFENVQRGLEPSDATEPTLNQDMDSKLHEMEYGHEVIEHAQDGDICMEKGLLHLALSSYIHAIEWMAISYLKEQGIDIIQKEKDGTYYNLAGGKNSILDELREESDIDQKTMSQIGSMNRAERRWMAHHKSGEVLPEEVDAVRARLQTLISDLVL